MYKVSDISQVGDISQVIDISQVNDISQVFDISQHTRRHFALQLLSFGQWTNHNTAKSILIIVCVCRCQHYNNATKYSDYTVVIEPCEKIKFSRTSARKTYFLALVRENYAHNKQWKKNRFIRYAKHARKSSIPSRRCKNSIFSTEKFNFSSLVL